MWYLLAEKATAPVLQQIAEGKKTVRHTMSAEQLAEAESKAALWLKNAKKQTSFVSGAEAAHGDHHHNKMHAGAR